MCPRYTRRTASTRVDCSARSVQLLAPLAAMFAGSRRLRRIRRNDRVAKSAPFLGAFRRLLLQIGGANIAAIFHGADLRAAHRRPTFCSDAPPSGFTLHKAPHIGDAWTENVGRQPRFAAVAPYGPCSVASRNLAAQITGGPLCLCKPFTI